MTIELRMLAFSIILGFVQLFLAARGATKQRGLKWNLSPRDEKKPDLIGAAARLDRAFKNFLETFPFFIGAVLLITFLKVENSLSALGAQLYFVGRVIYVPVYAIGTPVLRTIIWAAATVGIFLILGALL